jgi:hypothetical protein
VSNMTFFVAGVVIQKSEARGLRSITHYIGGPCCVTNPAEGIPRVRLGALECTRRPHGDLFWRSKMIYLSPEALFEKMTI